MKNRINTNSFKNAIGTVFLLAAAFFVCSTLISMRSVFADPIVSSNPVIQNGRQSPRANTNNSASKDVVSRSTVSRAGGRSVKSANVKTSSRNVGVRTVSQRGVTPTRANANSTRNIVSRTQNTAARTNTNRAIRARSGATPSSVSRVATSGSVMAGSRATSSTYSYLSSKLYTGSYSDVVDSSTGLIAAEAYSNCMESYYACMDEICTARSDTKGRCSCAGRATNFLTAEDTLEQANEELIKLSGQLALLIATKGRGEDLKDAFTLTDAEKVMNCVSYKEATDKQKWYEEHPTFQSEDSSTLVTSYTTAPWYCTKNDFGFNIGAIDGSGSDILAQLKSWANAKDLAKQYTNDDNDNLVSRVTIVSGVLNGLQGIGATDTEKAALDSLANKWGYDLFQYAHNRVCGRVLDSCFNGIYEACGTPSTVTVDGKTVRMKCANGAASNCPFNYNSYISVDTGTGEVVLSDRSTTSSNSSASCFGYASSDKIATSLRGVSSTNTTTDPYATLRGPVADARRSIMQKYLLDANAACDVYGAALKQTAQNINYQKIAAEQALQQKRLEFKQEESASVLANATEAMTNFNECISELWDCYDEYDDEDDKWTAARIKSYCAQVSQVPHCYEPMICSPLQSPLVAVVDKADKEQCSYTDYYKTNDCRNVVTISEILYGTGAKNEDTINSYASAPLEFEKTYDSKALREACLRQVVGKDRNDVDTLRGWDKTKKETESTSGN